MNKTPGLVAGFAVAAVVLAGCGGGSNGVAGTETSGQVQPSVESTGEAVEEGEAAPQVQLAMFDGSTKTLSEFHGDKPLVVNFWASWCPPCIAEMPDIEAVHEQFGDRVNFLGVNTQDTQEEAERLARETGVTYPLARDPDGAVFEDFGVFGMPSTFFVSVDGQLVDRHTGLLTKDALVEMINEELLAGSGP